MKLGIFGSRTLADDRVKMLIAEEIAETGADTIVTTQEPLGVCTVAQQVAKQIPTILELHFLNIPRYARGAFEHRSKAVIRSADRFLLIHDGVSHGTRNELEEVKKSGKPYRYEVLEPTDEKVQRRQDKKLEAFFTKRDKNEQETFGVDLKAFWGEIKRSDKSF